jgi:type II secretory pathway pseudopilin PulG
MSEQEKKQTGKGVLVISIVAIVVVAVLVGVIIFLLVNQKPQQEEKREVLVTEDNVAEFLENLKEQDFLEDVQPGYYTVRMVMDWHFENGSASSYDAYVENVEQNTNDVYFDVVLEDDESKVLYSSPIIPRGARLDDIKLDKKLDAGQYKAVCIYHLVDEDQNVISEVRMGFRIYVEG